MAPGALIGQQQRLQQPSVQHASVPASDLLVGAFLPAHVCSLESAAETICREFKQVKTQKDCSSMYAMPEWTPVSISLQLLKLRNTLGIAAPASAACIAQQQAPHPASCPVYNHRCGTFVLPWCLVSIGRCATG